MGEQWNHIDRKLTMCKQNLLKWQQKAFGSSQNAISQLKKKTKFGAGKGGRPGRDGGWADTKGN